MGNVLPEVSSAGAVILIVVLVIPLLKFILARARGRKITTPLDKQSIVLTGTGGSSRSETSSAAFEDVHASPPVILDSDKGTTYGGRKLLRYLHEDAQTAYSVFQRSVRESSDAKFFGLRPEGEGERQ